MFVIEQAVNCRVLRSSVNDELSVKAGYVQYVGHLIFFQQ